jgi:hypothetical protein
MVTMDNRFSNNVKNLITLASKVDGSNDYKEIIRALSFFLSHTNRNYYTETYLCDQFDSFESFLRVFYNKNTFSELLFKYLNRKFKKNDDQLKMLVIIDDIWIIGYENNQWNITLQEGNLRHISKNVIYVAYKLSHGEKTVEMHEEVDFREAKKELKIYLKIKKYYNELESYEDANNESKRIV